jgi:hypothetical protein
MAMPQFTLLDLIIAVPDDVTLSTSQAQLGCMTFRLEGPSVAHVRERIESAARRSYTIRRAHNATYMFCQERWIHATAIGPSQLDVMAYDPERLPFAQVDESGIRLGPLAIGLNGVCIVPRRERHDSSRGLWIGEWKIAGETASELSASIVEHLAVLGLRSVGTFAPRDARVGDTWSTEASNQSRLAKIYATQRNDHVLLRVEVVDGAQAAND